MACNSQRAPKTFIDSAKNFSKDQSKHSSLNKNMSKGSELSFGNKNPKQLKILYEQGKALFNSLGPSSSNKKQESACF